MSGFSTPNLFFFWLFFCVCSYFLPKGGIKNSHFASLCNTHKYIVFIHKNKNKNGSDDSTKNPRRVQRLLRYVLSLSSSFGLKARVGCCCCCCARAGHFLRKQIFPESKFCHHRLTELLFPINSLSVLPG